MLTIAASVHLQRRRAAVLAAILAAALAACATPVPQFYTLVAPAGQASKVSSGAYQINVLAVEIPDQVDLPQIVVREGNGQMVRVETRRWIAPLAGEIRNALADDLSRELGVRDVYGLANGAGDHSYAITLKVQRFDSALGAYARIDAIWNLRAPGAEQAATTCSSSVAENVGAGFDALTAGHQQALAAIAAQIAASIRTAQARNAPPSCP